MATPAHDPRVAEIMQLASEVFEDPVYSLEWLNQPNMAAGDRKPIELISTPEGLEIIKNILLRIQYGVLA